MELCSMLCASLDGRRVWGRMDTCIHMFTWNCHNIVNRLFSNKTVKKKKKAKKESMKQNTKQILQNIEHSLQNTNKQNTEKNKITFSFPQWMWLSWRQVSRLVFPTKIFLLIGTSRGCRVYQILSLDLKATVSHDQWTLWNPCIHLFIQLTLLGLLLCYLWQALGRQKKKKT